jgi:hypothetical protein
VVRVLRVRGEHRDDMEVRVVHRTDLEHGLEVPGDIAVEQGRLDGARDEASEPALRIVSAPGCVIA